MTTHAERLTALSNSVESMPKGEMQSFLNTRTAWDCLFQAEGTRTKTWRRFAIVMGAWASIATADALYQRYLSGPRTYVFAMDKYGHTMPFLPAEGGSVAAVASDQQVVTAKVEDLVTLMRGVNGTRWEIESNEAKLLQQLGPDAVGYLTSLGYGDGQTKADPRIRMQTETVQVNINACSPNAADSVNYSCMWTEQAWDLKGSKVGEPVHYVASMQIARRDMDPGTKIWLNNLPGVIIEKISISEVKPTVNVKK